MTGVEKATVVGEEGSSLVSPTDDQRDALAAAPDDEPLVMLNLLRFEGGPAGLAEYRKYGSAAIPMIRTIGGRILWQGRVDQVVIGDDSDGFDAIVLVEYPSRRAFLDMVDSPDYKELLGHRAMGLERTVLLACRTRMPAAE